MNYKPRVLRDFVQYTNEDLPFGWLLEGSVAFMGAITAVTCKLVDKTDNSVLSTLTTSFANTATDSSLTIKHTKTQAAALDAKTYGYDITILFDTTDTWTFARGNWEIREGRS